MSRFTHLGRTLSLAYPSHRVLLGLIVLGAVGGWAGPAGGSPAAGMFRAAAAVAIGWMLVRELEPARAWVALTGAAAAGAAVVFTGEAALVSLALLMVGARILTRSTGLIPRLTDIVAVGLVAGVFARSPSAWAAGLALACAVALDTNHDQPSPARYTWLALAIGVAVTISTVFSEALDLVWMAPGWPTWVLAGAGTALVATAPTSTAARNDVGEYFDPARLSSTRVLVVAAAALGTLAGGGLYARATWPMWIALIAAGAGAHLNRRR